MFEDNLVSGCGSRLDSGSNVRRSNDNPKRREFRRWRYVVRAVLGHIVI